ncbi:cold-shock protein [Streptomyces lydicus]|uniref:cold-shock protein n=1 Tax=Streptomyces lydicus TaxID=47763 RepID=UPI0036EA6EFF
MIMRVRAMPTGTVKWYEAGRGVGVITQDGTETNAMAFRSAIQGHRERGLLQGERVLFNITQDAAGIRADNIYRLGQL